MAESLHNEKIKKLSEDGPHLVPAATDGLAIMIHLFALNYKAKLGYSKGKMSVDNSFLQCISRYIYGNDRYDLYYLFPTFFRISIIFPEEAMFCCDVLDRWYEAVYGIIKINSDEVSFGMATPLLLFGMKSASQFLKVIYDAKYILMHKAMPDDFIMNYELADEIISYDDINKLITLKNDGNKEKILDMINDLNC